MTDILKPSHSANFQEGTCNTVVTEDLSTIGSKSTEHHKRSVSPDESGPEKKKSLLQSEDVIYASDMSLDSDNTVDKDDFRPVHHSDSKLYKEINSEESFSSESESMSTNMMHLAKSDLEVEDTPKLSKHERKQLYKMGCRPFINTSFGEAVMRAHSSDSSQNWLKFRVASYNVLSQDLLCANSYLYKSVKPSVLEWDYRKYRLMRDIFYADADVVCLQEVHQEHYETFFKGQLELKGYQSHFMKRTGSQSDGCASFFKTSVFNLDKVVPVAYHRDNVDVLNRHNVALLLLLSVKEHPAIKVCVSNTHLLFNPRRDDVRLAQLMILLAEIDRLAYYDTDVSGRLMHHPVIMCGDFNSEPHCDINKLIRRGSLNYDCPVAGSWDKKLLDKSVGITDQCQYIADVYWRFVSYARRWKNICNQVIPCMLDKEVTGISAGDSSAEENKHNNTKADLESVMLPANQESPVIPNPLPVFLSDSSLLAPGNDLPFTCDQSKESLVHNPMLNLSKVMCPVSFQFTFGSGSIYHYLSLNSVYTHGSRRNAEVTTNHSHANCTVDYIFYTRQRPDNEENSLEVRPRELRLLNRMKLLTEDEVLRLGGLPNSVMSSDHFLLCGTFALGL